jgi:hypothetical protein
LEAVFSVRSVLMLYNGDQLALQGRLETEVRKVEDWCEMVASLRGREHGNKGTSTDENTVG